ncbi:metal-dependent phosphohydrolase, partial [Vibrio splendidus]
TQLYVIAGVLFGTYGSRVCPMLESLTTLEIFTQVSSVFILLWLARHYLLSQHTLVKQGRFAQLDTMLFFAASIPFALYYNLSYEFTIDSNLKVLFGMSLFGFFTGTILQLKAKLSQIDEMEMTGQFDFHLIGERSSLVKQMIGLVIVLLVTLT